MMAPLSIQETLADARSRLAEIGAEQPRLEAELLLRHVLSIGTREFLLLERAVPLDPPLDVRFEDLLARRLTREPLQYVLGTVQFCEVELRVGSGVLIPRPETEVLVETTSDYVSRYLGDTGVLVDVGTGTGAIAISLLTRFPGWTGFGLDLSAPALSYAQSNAGVPVTDRFAPVQADLLGCLAPSRLDLIVSNPPYIPTAELRGLAPEVRDREPRLALDGGDDGMTCTRALVSDAARVLRSGGVLALELALGQSEAVRKYSEGWGFLHEETYRDLTGRERGVILRRS